MNLPLIIIGAILIIYNVREGAKRKFGKVYSNGRMTLLLFLSLVGAVMILFSGGSTIRNLVVLLIVSFVLAPFIAGITTGRKVR